jgi:hypothetical protein
MDEPPLWAKASLLVLEKKYNCKTPLPPVIAVGAECFFGGYKKWNWVIHTPTSRIFQQRIKEMSRIAANANKRHRCIP